MEDLRTEHPRGVGLTRRSAHLKRLGGPALGSREVALGARPAELVEQPEPRKGGIRHRGGQRSRSGEAVLDLRAVPGLQTDCYPPRSRAEADAGVIQAPREHEQLIRDALALAQCIGHCDGAGGIEKGLDECRLLTGCSGYRDRFCRELAAALRYAGVMQFGGEQREHPRALRIIARQGRRRGLERPHALGVHRVQIAEEPPAVCEHRAAQPVCIAELLRKVRRVEQCLAMVGVADLALGLPETDQELTAPRVISAGCLLVKFERLPVPARRLIWGELLKRPLCREACVVDRLTPVGADHRRSPVAGELAEALAGLIATLLLERFAHPLVQSSPARASQILIQRVLHQSMCEAELALSTARASGPKRSTRRPITSRTLSGSPRSARSPTMRQPRPRVAQWHRTP